MTKKFEVTIHRLVRQEVTIEVEADSEFDARDRALYLSRTTQDADWDIIKRDEPYSYGWTQKAEN